MKKKQITKNILKIASRQALAALIFLGSTPALSAIPYRNSIEAQDLIDAETKELNLSLLAKIQVIVEQNQFNMNHFIPLAGLPVNDDGSVISRHIMKQTMKTLMTSESGSAIVQGAQSLNSALGTSIDRHGHSVAVRVNAAEGGAEVAYKGIVSAALGYSVSDKETTFEVSQVIEKKTLAFTHTTNATESINTVGVRWSF